MCKYEDRKKRTQQLSVKIYRGCISRYRQQLAYNSKFVYLLQEESAKATVMMV